MKDLKTIKNAEIGCASCNQTWMELSIRDGVLYAVCIECGKIIIMVGPAPRKKPTIN